MNGETGRGVAADSTERLQPNRRSLPIQRPLTAQRNNAARHSRPRLTPGVVLRRRLIDLVDAGARRPVTLLCAGPGWGKTITVASWVTTATDRVAWLTLHPDDNDRTMFWTHVVGALRGAGAFEPGHPLADLEPAAGVTDAVVDQILDGLDALPVRVVLVLDDFHDLEAEAVLHDLDDLLRYPPDRLRLILVTRTEPSLRLHLLRASGEIAEIRGPDLAFRPDEAALLFANRNVRVSDDDVARLIEETQGWAAGLQLAVASLAQGRRIDDLAGDHGVADYLTREVLARLPPDVRTFLTRTSVLDEVCADLATALTGERYSQRILESLERANAFVQGLGSFPRWFRYHPLLRDVLRNELTAQSPELLPELHRIAARWYAEQGAVIDALRHAAAGRDWEFLARQAVDWVPLMLSADRAGLVAVLRQIPGGELPTTPELQVCDALLLFHAGDYANVPARLAAARDLRAERTGPCDLPLEVALLTIEAAVVNRVRGDMPGLVTATTAVLGRLSSLRFGELPALLQYRAIALNNKGVGLLWTGQLDRADRYLWAGVTAARAAGLVLVEINAVGHLALLAVLRGALREAYEHATLACDLAERRGVRMSLQAVAGQLALALVELEHNNVAEAERELRRAVEAHRADPEAAQVLVSSLTRARLHVVTGDLEAARAELRRARRDADPMMVAPALDRWHRLTQSEVDLASGHAEAVVARYGRHTDSLLPGETVCLARAELALGGLDLAEALAARARATSPGNLNAVWAWTVTALVADAQGHGNRSVDALSSAVRIAQREGIRRPFLSIGDRRLATLLERQRWLVRDNAAFVADLLAETTPTRPGAAPAPETDLSDRELEVLRYLPTVLTAAEIADELRVSVNTVKAHLRSIYRKLDVTRRREAVVRAREQNLI
ncbi:LuxR C-terminal-related transcriptional regulator [Virgisporangium ochraceum]|uniref:Transcriptional regulator n=1 Tax=Virgisporangium ochraceum TaxID=65505 RepID=A0A8J4A4L5_9ACTN|nr:LuxR C-terminal-related transcriptional regulator [Virgisporangium ochraceum]GIJ72621.1 transcriptional regulator [Virgisporangium ochraceum]